MVNSCNRLQAGSGCSTQQQNTGAAGCCLNAQHSRQRRLVRDNLGDAPCYGVVTMAPRLSLCIGSAELCSRGCKACFEIQATTSYLLAQQAAGRTSLPSTRVARPPSGVDVKPSSRPFLKGAPFSRPSNLAKLSVSPACRAAAVGVCLCAFAAVPCSWPAFAGCQQPCCAAVDLLLSHQQPDLQPHLLKRWCQRLPDARGEAVAVDHACHRMCKSSSAAESPSLLARAHLR